MIRKSNNLVDRLINKCDKLFGLFFVAILLVPIIGMMLRGQRDISVRENRALNQLPIISAESYMENEYQNNLELALNDQVLFSGTMKYIYNKVKSTSLEMAYEGINPLLNIANAKETEVMTVSSAGSTENTTSNKDKENVADSMAETTLSNEEISMSLTEHKLEGYQLVPKGEKLMLIEETNHLVYPNYELSQAQELLDNKISNINGLVNAYPDLDFYLYYIETDSDADFMNHINNHAIYNYMCENLDDKVVSDVQAIESTSDYTDCFYRTDHHWNVTGQLRGYQNITTLLGEVPNDEIEAVTFNDLNYFGYKARSLDDYTIKDAFGLLYSPLKTYETLVNDKTTSVNQKENYYNGIYNTSDSTVHYSVCYGYDFGLIQYNFQQEEAEDLLVFVDSFSNPINELIASHFNHTYIVDLRHYERDMGEVFNLENFLEEHDIDKVLLTGYYHFYVNDTFIIH